MTVESRRSSAPFCTQVHAIVRKNLTVTMRNKRGLAREVLTPLLFLGILIGMKQALPSTEQPRTNARTGISVSGLDLAIASTRRNELFVASSAECGAGCDAAAMRLADLLSAQVTGSPSNVTWLPSEAEALDRIKAAPSNALGAIILDSAGGHLFNPGALKYRIRMDGDAFAPGATAAFARSYGTFDPQSTQSLLLVVSDMQMAVVSAWQRAANVSGVLPSHVYASRLPKAAFFPDNAATAMSSVIPIYMVLIFSMQLRVMLQNVLEEKEKKILEAMRMAGLTDAANWVGWIATSAIKNVILIAIVVAAAKLGSIYPRSDWSVLLILFGTFACTAVAFTAALSTLFSQARVGGAVGMLGYIVASTPSYGLQAPGVSPAAKLAGSLLAPTGFSMANNIVTVAEGSGEGVNWNNIGDPSLSPVGVSVGSLIGMLVLDTILYVALAWYLGKVVPNEYGTTLPPHFLCTARYWRGPPPPDSASISDGPRAGGSPAAAAAAARESAPKAGDSSGSLLPQHGDPELGGAPDGLGTARSAGGPKMEAVDDEVARRDRVALRGLSKTYPSGGKDWGPVKALQRLSVDFYAGQVTALLGPNGSGKSTTFGMLTGLFGPTAGEAWIAGRSIVWDMAGARAQLGVCPQHDVLFDTLTVREHLELFGGIRGVPPADMAADTDRCIRDVGLEEAADQLASSLSGGQKRRLSLAIALVGDPPVLLLDEPTSGCDAAVRRKIWDLLTAKRAAGRTIVLSSHDMAECEVLADRVCILARGRLRVAGSTRFLKKEFGVGYHLTVSASAEASSARVLDVVRGHVPLATLETDKHDATTTDERQASAAGAAAGGSRGGATVRSATKEIAVTLPLSAVSRFPALFDAMDAAGADIGVLGYGLETTSLEEAFMRLVNALDVEADADEAARAEAAGAGLAGEGSGSARPRAASTTELAAVGRARAGLTDEAVVSVEGTGVRLPAEAAGAAAAPGAGESAALLKAAKPTGAKLGDISIASRMEPATLRQVKAVMMRRFQQVRRDYRALWLQCVLPVAFCAISIAFSSLSELNTTVEPKVVPFSTASWQAGMPEGSPVSALTVPFWVDTQDVDAYGSGSGPNSTQLADLLRSTFTATGSDRGIAGLSGGKARPVDATGLLSADPTSDAAAAYLIGPPGEPSLGFQAAAIVGSPATSFRPGWTMDMLFNTSFGNAPCAVFQLATNALLAAESGPLDGAFDPLPRSVTGFTPSDNTGMIGSYLSGTLSAFYVAMGFAVLPGIQAIAVVKERETRVRAVQAIMGLSSQAYWAGTWLWDGLGMGLVPGFAAIAVLGIAGLVQAVNLPAVAVLFILFSLSTPGPAYVLSFAFESAASAQTWIVIITTVTTVVSFFGSFVLSFPGLLPLDSPVPNAISIAFQVFLPPFCLAKGLADVATRATCPSVFNPVPPDGGPCVVPNAFDWDIAGSKLLFMAVSIPGWALVIAVIEYFQDPARGEPPTGPDAYKDPLNAVGAPRDASGRLLVEEDDDVVGERARVESHGLGSAPLVASSLRKVYFGHARPRVAVSRVDLAVPDGEIFGLLGPNGAGKTTLQKMLVGDLRPSAGKAAIDGRAVGAARGTGGGKGGIGYCPQFDALVPELTGREMLRFYASVAGLPESEVEGYIADALQSVGVSEFSDRPCKNYSGGNKRKLSLAVAYLAAPRIVFLDEASAGVDPVARRKLWEVIWRSRAGRCSVVTTHVLEEAATLCSRIGIVVSGVMACLGSPQHLKTRYGAGLQLDVECDDVSSLVTELAEAASAEVSIVEQHARYARIQVQVSSSKAAGGAGPERPPVAAVFRALLGREDVTDFSVTQPTLEAIFLRFAKAQEAAEAAETSMAAVPVSTGLFS
ncbi:hypothetical protein FNF28_02846 [Cafeteria roenbergensis]|uniref:ABC transporter domain-containing protein n=1 Tax=Cafeteria roenbergensis TaxID=33653 RepID=A0A5A8DRH9_CAFRO|nr:hypothetical protein FNF28_02846 [Cafeteria roenbergensis]